MCQKEHVDNTLFCDECGAYLLEDDSPATDHVGVKMSMAALEIANGHTSELTDGTGPLAIAMRIGERAREVNIPLSKPVHMGRLDPASNIFPEVDLTSDGGVEKGVSRRHARILKRGAKIYVEDLGSSNGTFVNGQKLSPYFPEALTNGDNLRLGGLEIEVSLKK
jgi:pSer/pThr/pTyr-binding forkhead associated (FHA) protein